MMVEEWFKAQLAQTPLPDQLHYVLIDRGGVSFRKHDSNDLEGLQVALEDYDLNMQRDMPQFTRKKIKR
jgi:hypothetical protein